jgi:hypothetical protein
MHTPLDLNSLFSTEACYFDDENPCSCCTEDQALFSDNKLCILYWHCLSSGLAVMIAENPNKERSYIPGVVEMRQSLLKHRVNDIHTSWALILDEEDYQRELMMTDEERAEIARKLEQKLKEEKLALKASIMFNYAESQKHLNTRGKGANRHIDKIDEPCKFLYCDEHSDKRTWKKDDRGKLCAPIRKALTGSECWAHEYHDPRSNNLLTPHTCKRLHPNEPGWRNEWNTDRTFRPSAPAPTPNRFSIIMNTGVQRPKRVENGAW